MTPAPSATKPAAPNMIPITNDNNKELIKLNKGLAWLHLRHAGIRAASSNSRIVEVIARIIIIEKSIESFHHYLSLH
jgi:hypothetical protein